MDICFFVSDLHGKMSRYESLLKEIRKESPGIVFIGGDLLPHKNTMGRKGFEHISDFVTDYLIVKFRKLKGLMGDDYPRIFLIPGNDDPGEKLGALPEAEQEGLWINLNMRSEKIGDYRVFGYSFVPPTPFLLKDWEKYDVSRYVDPGCIPPAEGIHTIPPDGDPEWDTMAKDLQHLTGDDDLEKSIFLFHSPPYGSNLDRAALDGKMIEYVPLDVHVGSMAIQRLIEDRQPMVTLHGHVHESTRLTGYWKQQTGRTISMNAAHDGPELALIRFNPDFPDQAERKLL